MRILFTGASSFTGSWFVRELATRGHEVVATMTREPGAYEELRGERVRAVAALADVRYDCEFGSPALVELAESGSWDLLCHHAARVGNYQSAEFDVAAAVAENTRELPQVLAALASRGCARVVLTGSYFERGEGSRSEESPAVSAYGLSKALTSDAVRREARRAGMTLGKFVIPNPFGPWEEPRFTTYLARTWLSGGSAHVATPAYERDNIHVSLLTVAYAGFAESLPRDGGFHRVAPSGYRETQGAFAQRVARELEPRLGVPCALELAEQTEFPEPRVRFNPDELDEARLGWSETGAWDELAAWYRESVD